MAKGGTSHKGKVSKKAPSANNTEPKDHSTLRTKLAPCLRCICGKRRPWTMRVKAGVIKNDTASKDTTTTKGVTEKITSKGATTVFRSGKPMPSSQRQTTASQLEAQLKRHGFTPERNFTVLHAPPSQAPFWLRSSNLWERLGRRLPWLSGGVLMVEVSKQVYAPTRGGLLQRATKPVRLWEPAAQPVASPKQ